MKKTVGILLLLVLLPSLALAFFYGIRINLIPREIEFVIEQAIVLSEMRFTPTERAGKTLRVFPGDVLGEGMVIIQNTSPSVQSVLLLAKPEEGHAFLDVLLKRREILDNVVTLQPGETITLEFRVIVSFNQPLTFRGVQLVIETLSPVGF